MSKSPDLTLDRYRTPLQRYEHELGDFEQQYQIDSHVFYQRFQDGEMGEGIPYFEWAGLPNRTQINQIHTDKTKKDQ